MESVGNRKGSRTRNDLKNIKHEPPIEIEDKDNDYSSDLSQGPFVPGTSKSSGSVSSQETDVSII